MPIDSKHVSYQNMNAIQDKCRVICQGEDAVKAAGTTFLPMLGGQNIDDYESYKNRASFFNASGRTLAGLTGVVFRKPPKVDFPNEDFLEKVTLSGDDYIVFLRSIVRDILQVGRVGLLADMKDNQTSPHVAVYESESIINWRTEIIDGEKKTVMVVLEEQSLDYSADPFEPEPRTLYRVLALTDLSVQELKQLGENSTFALQPSINNVVDGDGRTAESYYAVAVYEKDEKERDRKGNAKFRLVEGPFFPAIRGKKLKYIPFTAINASDLNIDTVENPPILDVVNVNLAHYRMSADLKHGLHFSALPTAWVAGFQSDQELRIGSQTAWVAEDPQASAHYLEFTGAGLGALRDDLKDMQDQMAVLGSRLLEEPKRQVEAAETHRSRKAGEESVVGSLASNVESGVQKTFVWCAEWMAESPDDVMVQLNKDYMSQVIDPSMMTALMMALQQGRISYDTFIYNLQQGEVLPDGRTAEDELELIMQNPAVPVAEEMDLEDEEEDEEGDEETEETEE